MVPVRPGSSIVVVFLLCLLVRASTLTTPASDWRMGDLFVASSVVSGKPSSIRGEYVVYGPDGAPKGEIVGQRARAFTGGCAVDSFNGQLWAAGYDGNTLSRYEPIHNAQGEHDLLESIALRGQTFVNGKSRGLVQAVGFDAAGFAYVGTTNGSNQLLKFSPSGAQVDTFVVPPSANGMARFDIAADQRTVYFTSGDNVVRRYDLATRSMLSDFATLIDGSLHGIRVLPNERGVLVAGSVGITRLDMNGQYVARHWLPATSFTAMNITPDGREFWTSTVRNELYKYDIATGTVVLGPIATGLGISGLCVKLEYTAAENICREADENGEPVQVPCPSL